MTKDVRRVVTGHDGAGKAIVLEDGLPPKVIRSSVQAGLAFFEVWNTTTMPQPIAAGFDEPTVRHSGTAPPKGGTVIRIVDLPPEGPDGPAFDKEQSAKLFAAVGLEGEARRHKPGRHPLMHRTESIDYGIVIEGEMTLVLDDSAVDLKPGSVVIQRGTNHAWANRSGEPCRMLFILVDGQYAPEIAKALEDRNA